MVGEQHLRRPPYGPGRANGHWLVRRNGADRLAGLAVAGVQPRKGTGPRGPFPSIPAASACSQARRHASACVRPLALTAFSPFVPLTHQRTPAAVRMRTSPTDQPARCRRAKDLSTVR
jgi:hypothetical protein